MLEGKRYPAIPAVGDAEVIGERAESSRARDFRAAKNVKKWKNLHGSGISLALSAGEEPLCECALWQSQTARSPRRTENRRFAKQKPLTGF